MNASRNKIVAIKPVRKVQIHKEGKRKNIGQREKSLFNPQNVKLADRQEGQERYERARRAKDFLVDVLSLAVRSLLRVSLR